MEMICPGSEASTACWIVEYASGTRKTAGAPAGGAGRGIEEVGAEPGLTVAGSVPPHPASRQSRKANRQLTPPNRRDARPAEAFLGISAPFLTLSLPRPFLRNLGCLHCRDERRYLSNHHLPVYILKIIQARPSPAIQSRSALRANLLDRKSVV